MLTPDIDSMGDRRSPIGGEPTTEEEVHVSQLLKSLSNQRRRYALYCLYRYETPMALADLADEIVRMETDAPPSAVPETREQVYTHLYHCHLPKLAEVGMVSFDLNENLVSLGDPADEVKQYVQEAVDEKWSPKE